MSFTPITIVANLRDPDGSPANGTIVFGLAAPMQNGDELVEPSQIVGVVGGGELLTQGSEQPIVLLANDDTGTTPAAPNATYLVTEQIEGASAIPLFSVLITHLATITDVLASTRLGSPVVQLDTYTAQATMVGNLITGIGIPSLTTVLSINLTLNQVTMSANATATGTTAVTIGGVVDLATLTPLWTVPDLIAFIPWVAGVSVGDYLQWNGTEWVSSSTSPAVTITSPDGSIVVGGTGTNPTLEVVGSRYDPAGAAAAALTSAETYAGGVASAAGAAAVATAEAFTTTAVAVETTRAETAEVLASQKSANLGDLASASTARTNLGLGSAATQSSSAFDAVGAATTAAAAALTSAETFATAAVATETTRAETEETVLAASIALRAPILALANAGAPYTVSSVNLTANQIATFDTSSNAITANLPAQPAEGSVVVAKLITQLIPNLVTLQCGSGDTINRTGGVPSATLWTSDQVLYLQYHSTGLSSGFWLIVDFDQARAVTRTATYVLASSQAPPAVKGAADAVCTGTVSTGGDEVAWHTAVAYLQSVGGGKILLIGGQFFRTYPPYLDVSGIDVEWADETCMWVAATNAVGTADFIVGSRPGVDGCNYLGGDSGPSFVPTGDLINFNANDSCWSAFLGAGGGGQWSSGNGAALTNGKIFAPGTMLPWEGGAVFTGTITVTSVTDVTGLTITGAAGSGSVVTFQCVNTLTAGMIVQVAGVTPAAWNGVFIVASATGTAFTVASTLSAGVVTVNGTCTTAIGNCHAFTYSIAGGALTTPGSALWGNTASLNGLIFRGNGKVRKWTSSNVGRSSLVVQPFIAKSAIGTSFTLNSTPATAIANASPTRSPEGGATETWQFNVDWSTPPTGTDGSNYLYCPVIDAADPYRYEMIAIVVSSIATVTAHAIYSATVQRGVMNTPLKAHVAGATVVPYQTYTTTYQVKIENGFSSWHKVHGAEIDPLVSDGEMTFTLTSGVASLGANAAIFAGLHGVVGGGNAFRLIDVHPYLDAWHGLRAYTANPGVGGEGELTVIGGDYETNGLPAGLQSTAFPYYGVGIIVSGWGDLVQILGAGGFNNAFADIVISGVPQLLVDGHRLRSTQYIRLQVTIPSGGNATVSNCLGGPNGSNALPSTANAYQIIGASTSVVSAAIHHNYFDTTSTSCLLLSNIYGASVDNNACFGSITESGTSSSNRIVSNRLYGASATVILAAGSSTAQDNNLNVTNGTYISAANSQISALIVSTLGAYSTPTSDVTFSSVNQVMQIQGVPVSPPGTATSWQICVANSSGTVIGFVKLNPDGNGDVGTDAVEGDMKVLAWRGQTLDVASFNSPAQKAIPRYLGSDWYAVEDDDAFYAPNDAGGHLVLGSTVPRRFLSFGPTGYITPTVGGTVYCGLIVLYAGVALNRMSFVNQTAQTPTANELWLALFDLNNLQGNGAGALMGTAVSSAATSGAPTFTTIALGATVTPTVSGLYLATFQFTGGTQVNLLGAQASSSTIASVGYKSGGTLTTGQATAPSGSLGTTITATQFTPYLVVS